jgi:hypothetical protein
VSGLASRERYECLTQTARDKWPDQSRCRADIADRFKRLAEKNGRTVQQEVRVALRKHVEREGQRSDP